MELILAAVCCISVHITSKSVRRADALALALVMVQGSEPYFGRGLAADMKSIFDDGHVHARFSSLLIFGLVEFWTGR